MIRRNLFRDLHQRRSKQGQPNREATKIHSNCNSNNNAMQITSLSIITTVAALITDRGEEPDHSSKAPIKTNTITKGLTPSNNNSSNRTVAQIPDTTRADDLTALGRMTLGRLYEPSSSCSSSTNQGERPRAVIGGVGGGGGDGGGRGCLIYC